MIVSLFIYLSIYFSFPFDDGRLDPFLLLVVLVWLLLFGVLLILLVCRRRFLCGVARTLRDHAGGICVKSTIPSVLTLSGPKRSCNWTGSKKDCNRRTTPISHIPMPVHFSNTDFVAATRRSSCGTRFRNAVRTVENVIWLGTILFFASSLAPVPSSSIFFNISLYTSIKTANESRFSITSGTE